MNRLLLKTMLMVMVVSLLYLSRVPAQERPTSKKATTSRISQGPEVERADPDFAIVGGQATRLGAHLCITA